MSLIPGPSPLFEVDPDSIDELINRIDEGMKLGQIPAPSELEPLVLRLRKDRELFLQKEKELPLKGARKAKPTSIKQALEL